MISSHAALSQLRAMNDQVVDPSSGPRHESHAIGRLLGSLGRLSCTGNDPLDSSCHLMGCMRSYTTLITRDAPDGTDRHSIAFKGQYGGAYSGATIAFITCTSPGPTTRNAWARTPRPMLQQWDVGMAQQLALLQAEETSQPPADHGQSPVVFDAEGESRCDAARCWHQ